MKISNRLQSRLDTIAEPTIWPRHTEIIEDEGRIYYAQRTRGRWTVVREVPPCSFQRLTIAIKDLFTRGTFSTRAKFFAQYLNAKTEKDNKDYNKADIQRKFSNEVANDIRICRRIRPKNDRVER